MQELDFKTECYNRQIQQSELKIDKLCRPIQLEDRISIGRSIFRTFHQSLVVVEKKGVFHRSPLLGPVAIPLSYLVYRWHSMQLVVVDKKGVFHKSDLLGSVTIPLYLVYLFRWLWWIRVFPKSPLIWLCRHPFLLIRCFVAGGCGG